MKVKIITGKVGWWYEHLVGEVFDIAYFTYHSKGSNHSLDINSYEELHECIKRYGQVSLHVKHEYHYLPQIYIEDTDYVVWLKLWLRKKKLEKIEQIDKVIKKGAEPL